MNTLQKILLFEISTPSFDEGYHKSMERNGVIKSIIRHININEISSIQHYIGELLHDGWNCSRIKMKNGDTFIDYRLPNDLINAIENYILTTKK